MAGGRHGRDAALKIRFGVGLGRDSTPADLPRVIDQLESAGVDSLWFSELVYSRQVEPFVGMAYALSRTRRLKVGTGVTILPGRNPVFVAKRLTSLAALAPKRVLPVFGLSSANPAERGLFPVPRGQRGEVFDESLRLLRALLTEPSVDFRGEFLTVEGATIGPRPDPPLDIWLGGSAPGALRRIGRLADGWLGSFLSPDDAGRAVEAIKAAAAEAGREIEPDHYGISLSVADGEIPPGIAAVARARRPGTDPAEMIAADWPALHSLLDRHIAAGLTKFVIRPAGATGFDAFLDRFVSELKPREN